MKKNKEAGWRGGIINSLAGGVDNELYGRRPRNGKTTSSHYTKDLIVFGQTSAPENLKRPDRRRRRRRKTTALSASSGGAGAEEERELRKNEKYVGISFAVSQIFSALIAERARGRASETVAMRNFERDGRDGENV